MFGDMILSLMKGQKNMKVPFSKYLDSIADGLKLLIADLSEDHDYVSVLATDSLGFSIITSLHMKKVSSQNMTSERGIVVRVARHDHYSEYACNDFDPKHWREKAEQIREAFNHQEELLSACGVKPYVTGILADEMDSERYEAQAQMLPEECDLSLIVEQMNQLCHKTAEASEYVYEVQSAAQSTHISKMFLSCEKDMRQSYVYTEATIVPLVSKDGKNANGYKGVSGRVGPEIISCLQDVWQDALKQAEDILHAQRIEPGEYDIITSPEVSGLIAHEAFGHGVEMDMFVKHRALGEHYIDQRVGSDLVTMHEGALCVENVSSYIFDDEGNRASDTVEIDHGILKTGICDALSAQRLGITPTGNGKRQNFEHKVYTRMTNTLFDAGNDTLEDMIASIEHGYLLEGMESGMEDPKHWGIQCIISLGREIRDGKLTGKVVAPIIMTGYVPDILGNITMASTNQEVFGNGFCGKGHKEIVKVADGGPYLKTKGILA